MKAVAVFAAPVTPPPATHYILELLPDEVAALRSSNGAAVDSAVKTLRAHLDSAVAEGIRQTAARQKSGWV